MYKPIISITAIALIFILAVAAPNIKSKNVSLNNTRQSETQSTDAPQPTIPQMINYQGKLTDAGGNPQNGNFDMTFTTYDALTGGTQYWTETQTGVTVTNGLFNVLLGCVNSIDPATEFPTGPNCYLEITVGTQTISPRQRIVSNGYTFFADEADDAANLGGVPASNYVVRPIQATDISDGAVTMPKINQASATTGQVIKWTGSAWAPGNDSAGGSPSGSAGGDLTGTYPNPTIANNAVTTAKIQDGQVQTADIEDSSVTLAKINPTGSSSGQAITSTGSGTVPNWSNPTPGPHNHLGETWTTTTYDIGLKTVVDRNTWSAIYGRIDSVVNSGIGAAYGGRFFGGGSGTGYKFGVYGSAYAPSSSTDPSSGVWGESNHNGTGDACGGYFSAGGTGTGFKYGVQGAASAPSGSSRSCYGVCASGWHAGSGNVYGGYFDGHHNGAGTGTVYGVYGYAFSYYLASSNAYGGWFKAEGSGSGTRYGVYSTTAGSGTSYAGYFVGNHVITGTKSAAVKIGKDDWRLVYCQESPELWFEDFGQGQLQNGRVHIELEPIFLKTVTISNEHPMNVFVQLKGDCNGVYVKDGKTGFDVIELQDGKSNAQFTYRVVAKRVGYENLRLKRMEPGTNPEELEAEHAKAREKMKRERNNKR